MEHQEHPRLTPRRNRKLLFWSGVGLTTLVIAIIAINRLSSGWSQAAGKVRPHASQTLADENAVELVAREGQALAQSQLLAAADTGRKALDAVTTLETEINRWDEEIVPLLANDKGRAIAASPQHVQAFIVLYEKQRATKTDAQTIRQRINTTLRPVNEALESSDSAYRPDTSLTNALKNARQEADNAAQLYRQHREVIEGMIPVQGTPSPSPTTPQLSAAIEALKRQHAEEQAARISAAETEARRDRDERIAKAKAEQIREDAILEEKRIANETAAKKVSAKQEELRTLAADANVQAKFKPFLDKGLFIMNVKGNYKYEAAQSASYQDLVNAGCLSNYWNFVEAATGYGGWGTSPASPEHWRDQNNFINNDRQRWPAPNSDSDHQEYGKRWELFRQLAPIWVETGLLSH